MKHYCRMNIRKTQRKFPILSASFSVIVLPFHCFSCDNMPSMRLKTVKKLIQTEMFVSHNLNKIVYLCLSFIQKRKALPCRGLSALAPEVENRSQNQRGKVLFKNAFYWKEIVQIHELATSRVSILVESLYNDM